MARYKLILEYDGTNLIGFQKNKDGDSVQALVEDAVFKFCGEHVEIVGCGRTDAGVHALAMPAHFQLAADNDQSTIKKALNFYLMDSPVSVVSCEQIADDWHARFSCVRRNYRYRIANQDFPPVLEKDFVWWVPQSLDVDAMRAAAARLIGEHDFTSFRAMECQAKSPIKTLDRIELIIDNGQLTIDLSARSFLHHQVRNIVGTLVEIGRGKPFDIDAVLDARDRSAAGPTAPAKGLSFVSGEYGDN